MRIKYLWVALSVAVAMAAVAVAVSAGHPDAPPGPPESTYSYTLEDIYQRLDSGAIGAPVTFTEPISGPGTGTMHTLDDIMGAAPAVDETNGATQAQVPTGRTAWGLTGGAWGVMTGTMPDNGAVTIVPTTTAQTIAAGYHSGSGTVVGDSDLVSGNVRSGVDLFGVSGDPNVADTSSGDAVAGEILTGNRAWVGGVEVMGTMLNNGGVTIVPTTVDQTIALGYHNGSGRVEGDVHLVASNIRTGVVLFGVRGTYDGGPAYPARVPKTGQTTSYVTGDDGALEVGVPWPSPRFITGTTGIVTDTLTGLVWLQNANCANAQRDWATALADVAQLNTDGTMNSHPCGDTSNGGSHQRDWRLPNVRELQSLIHYGFDSPALSNTTGTSKWTAGDPFAGVQMYYYWSSTTRAASTPYAWSVLLTDGDVGTTVKSVNYYVWPVRGEQ